MNKFSKYGLSWLHGYMMNVNILRFDQCLICLVLFHVVLCNKLFVIYLNFSFIDILTTAPWTPPITLLFHYRLIWNYYKVIWRISIGFNSVQPTALYISLFIVSINTSNFQCHWGMYKLNYKNITFTSAPVTLSPTSI